MSYDIYNKTKKTGVLKLLDEKHVHYVTMYNPNSGKVGTVFKFESK